MTMGTLTPAMAEGNPQHPILQSRAHHCGGNSRDMLKDYAEIYRIAAH